MIGQTISHYRILEKLGEGGMGIVYKAHDTTLDRTVALKFLPHYLTSDPAEKERFYHEAKAAAALTHQNIAVVYEIGEHDNQLFIAMECVEGETLRNVLIQAIHESPLPMSKILDVAIQISDGLAAAHEKGIVHRDIKPENIILTPKGQAKITDFGLAKLKGATKLTKTGSTLGTAAYMSPEQARGEDVDQRTDIFSLGVVVYEMLAGKLPFRGEHTAALMYSIANEEPAPLARFNEKVTDELQRIVSKALEKDRDDRYQHVDEMLADLRRERKKLEYAKSGYVKAGEMSKQTVPAVEPTKHHPSRKWVVKAFAAIGIVTVLVVAFLLLRPVLFEEAVSSERRTVAVISFVNQTGDASYDYLQDAIPNLLITNLEQSKYLRVETWERLYDLRKQIGKADVKFVDREMGFELCRMDGVDAIVLGSFTKAGNVFATDVKVLDVRTKQLLKSANSKGDGVGSILKTQIDELSKEISRGIGLSERKIEATPMQIAEVTTTSMDAYNYFLRGRDDYLRFYYDDARRFLEKAVTIDSTFAVAYIYLAFTCDGLNDTKAANAAYQSAARYYQKAPELERLMIGAALARNIEQNRDKARSLMKEAAEKYPKYKWAHFYLGTGYAADGKIREAIEQLTVALQLDPDFGPALNQLGYVYANSGEFEKAIECFQRYAAVNPGDANPYDSMAELYFKMGRLDDAVAKYKEVLDIEPAFYSSYMGLTYVYLLEQKPEDALTYFDRFISIAPTAGLKSEGYGAKAFADYILGRLKKSAADLDSAQTIASAIGDEGGIARVELFRGWRQYDMHRIDSSRQSLEKYFSFSAIRNPSVTEVIRAFTLGLLALAKNQVPVARARLAEMDSLLPAMPSLGTDYPYYRRDILSAEILLAEDSVDSAIQMIDRSGVPSLPNLSSEAMQWYNVPFSRDLLARAYIKKGALDKAIREYEKLITFDSTSNDRRLILPKYHYVLAKLYEQRGLPEKAIQEYKRFLTLWKDADRDLPELKDAIARLQALTASTRR
jgi:serine/threonine protein kinase/Flp pilus assembly protein TadD